MTLAMAAATPQEAAAILRDEENRRIQEIRQIVITATNSVPIRVEHVVDGGPLKPRRARSAMRGVIVGHQTRQGQLGIRRPQAGRRTAKRSSTPDGKRKWIDEPDKLQGVILLRKNEHSIPALHDVLAKIDELNNSPGRLLPGVKIEPFYNRASLIDVTTETVHENLILGMVLVTVILLMFLSNVRSALIVAINIPLALLFAFAVLLSARQERQPAVDRRRRLRHHRRFVGDHGREHLPAHQLRRACRPVAARTHSALLPRGRAGLVLHHGHHGLRLSAAVHHEGPGRADLRPHGRHLRLCPGRRTDPGADRGAGAVPAVVQEPAARLATTSSSARSSSAICGSWTCCLRLPLDDAGRHGRRWSCSPIGLLPFLGREFMPELEEGNMIVRGTFPVNVSLEEAVAVSAKAREIIWKFPEVEAGHFARSAGPDDGTDPTGYYNVECFVPLHPPDEWPIPPGRIAPRAPRRN